ncbi:MAG: hypothetical protein EZS28_053736 [Streblomastix strix]|uniref:Uncharacterized protein n=1 Tax=Streblomastix strix TaxID=222440 RepID=A0A5J4R3J3_9EUKA|nr:MAG: hypothetical protein EZS28_053736 [Streblomastix strix]
MKHIQVLDRDVATFILLSSLKNVDNQECQNEFNQQDDANYKDEQDYTEEANCADEQDQFGLKVLTRERITISAYLPWNSSTVHITGNIR